MNLADNTMVFFGLNGLTLTFITYGETSTTLVKRFISKYSYVELYSHLNEGKSVWGFECRKITVFDDPLDIVDLLGCEFHALASEEELSEVIMQGIANEVILQNHKKLQEIGR